VKPVDPSVYRAALDRIDVFKTATIKAQATFADLEKVLRMCGRPVLADACKVSKEAMDLALETVADADRWDFAESEGVEPT
jgi:hypothetical protein